MRTRSEMAQNLELVAGSNQIDLVIADSKVKEVRMGKLIGRRNFVPTNQITDIFGYSDTAYSDTPLTVTVSVHPMLPKSVNVSKCLLTVTLFLCPEGVTVTEDVCN